MQVEFLHKQMDNGKAKQTDFKGQIAMLHALDGVQHLEKA
jgi:hypothetical protein